MKELSLGAHPQPPSPERAACKLARLAACDVSWGAASALVRLKRLRRSPHHYLYAAAVSETYTKDYAPEFTLWECPDCGLPVYGQTAAAEHCAKGKEEFEL
jgi:hypothetical protein